MRKASTGTDIGLAQTSQRQCVGNFRQRIDDRRGKHPELDEELIEVDEVAVFRGRGGHQQADAEAEQRDLEERQRQRAAAPR